MNLQPSIKILFALLLIGGTTLKAQLALNNNGSLSLEITNGLVVHSDGPYISNSEANTPIISSGGEHISPNSLRLINNFTPPQNGKHYSSTSISNQKHYETSWL